MRPCEGRLIKINFQVESKLSVRRLTMHESSSATNKYVLFTYICCVKYHLQTLLMKKVFDLSTRIESHAETFYLKLKNFEKDLHSKFNEYKNLTAVNIMSVKHH